MTCVFSAASLLRRKIPWPKKRRNAPIRPAPVSRTTSIAARNVKRWKRRRTWIALATMPAAGAEPPKNSFLVPPESYSSSPQYPAPEHPSLLCLLSGCTLSAFSAFGEELKHLAVESGDIRRLAARHPILVTDHFLVLPLAARVANVILNRMVSG